MWPLPRLSEQLDVRNCIRARLTSCSFSYQAGQKRFVCEQNRESAVRRVGRQSVPSGRSPFPALSVKRDLNRIETGRNETLTAPIDGTFNRPTSGLRHTLKTVDEK